MKTELRKIDVVVITKNSEKPCLRQSLESITRNIPVRQLIVVDGYSTDSTVRIAEAFGAFVLFDEGTRATARQRGIEAVETPYFAFVDSDAILRPSWFEKVFKGMKAEVGEVYGLNRTHYPGMRQGSLGSRVAELEAHLNLNPPLRGMVDTLIRKEAVKDVRIPRQLHVFEDYYIRKHILRKGYVSTTTRQIVCDHHPMQRGRDKDAYRSSHIGRRLGVVRARFVLWLLGKSILRAPFLLGSTLAFGSVLEDIRMYVMSLAGYLTAEPMIWPDSRLP